MITLRVSDAVELVRKNLDELDPNGSIMMEDENGSADEYGDNMSLDDIVARTLPEAINAVHLSAPVQLLEGKAVADEDLVSVSVQADGILSFALTTNSHYLRLVAFEAADSDIVVTDVLGEATPEGRKQLNPYIRGRADRPRLVLSQGRHSGPAFKYYSLDTDRDSFPSYVSNPSSAIYKLSFLQEQFFDEAATEYPICRRLRQNIIDCLTAMVLETYNNQQAKAYYQKANSYSTL